jgi:hypothetical protein
MEQTTQQITQKPCLPIKTKIAAWWMIVAVGGGLIFLGGKFLYIASRIAAYGVLDALIMTAMCFLLALLFIFLGILLLKRKKIGWFGSIIFLFILLIIIIVSFVKEYTAYMDIERWPYYYYDETRTKKYYEDPLTGEKVDEPKPQTKTFLRETAPFFSVLFIVFFFPLILLFLDYKNFLRLAIKPTELTKEKIPLPTKTKVATYWILIIGIINIILGITFQVFEEIEPLIWGIILFVFSCFLLERKKWAWWALILTIVIMTIFRGLYLWEFMIRSAPTPPFIEVIEIFFEYASKEEMISLFSQLALIILSLIPFILFLLDRKNFWKIAS